MKTNQLHINLSKCAHMYFRPNLHYIFIAAKNKEQAYKSANEVLRSVYIYMKTNKLHINLSKCAHMYFRPNLHYKEHLSCARTIVRIKRVKKIILSSHYLKIYQSLFVSHLTYGISCWGGVYYSKLQKLFNIQKRCIRILFGESYSFDHPEYYATCCRTKTYQEHVALKNYALEHTKPLFNKHSLLTLHNLYASRSLVELIKILKLHSPYILFMKTFNFAPELIIFDY